MLYRRLESGWAVILPGAVVAMLAWKELSWEAWRVIIVLALLATIGMLYQAITLGHWDTETLEA